MPLTPAAEAGLQQRRVYALHLRRYNDALLIHDTVRAMDALTSLQDFYHRECATKTQILRAERLLLALFDGEAQRFRTGPGVRDQPGHRRQGGLERCGSNQNPRPMDLTGLFPHL